VIVADEEKEVEEKKVRVEELIVSGFGGWIHLTIAT
jgi:hypothetical protein